MLAARRLAPLVGHAVTEGALAGATIEAVEPYGKHLLIRTDDGRTLHVHLGMHGGVRLRPRGAGSWAPCAAHRRPGDAVIHHPSRYDVRRSPHPPAAAGPGPARRLRRRPSICAAPGWSTGRSARCCSTSACLPGSATSAKSETLWRCRVDPFAPVSALCDDRLLALPPRRPTLLQARRRRRRPAARARSTSAGRPCPRCRTPIRTRPPGRGPSQHLLVPGCAISLTVVRRRSRRSCRRSRARRPARASPSGDALGAALEWLAPEQITARYGGPLRDMVASGLWADGGVDRRHGDDAGARPRAWPTAAATTRTTCSPATRCGSAVGPKDIGSTVRGALERARSADEARGRLPSATTRSPAAAAPATAR